jgi:recombinational DNA repair protein (RecF pathway)
MTSSWIILRCRRWRPTLYQLMCFSEHQGLTVHFVFPSQIAKRRFQPGDMIAGTIDQRTFDVSTVFSPQVFALNNGMKLAILSCVTELLLLTLPEHHPYPHLYQATEPLLRNLGHHQHQPLDHIAAYSCFERLLLEEIGFGLSLDSCTVTGKRADLTYISPKTGRAVSREAGAAYHGKLLPLPQVWQTPPRGNDWDQALKVSEFFIKKQLREGQELPFMRGYLVRQGET